MSAVCAALSCRVGTVGILGRGSTSCTTAVVGLRSRADDEGGIDIAGGASTVRQALAAGVIDELTLDVAPVLLGSGERLFDGVETLGFEPVEVLHSPLATHIGYRRARQG